jgi:membrane protease YdiL (CAAX protease family)
VNDLPTAPGPSETTRFRSWEGFSLWATVFVVAGFAYTALGVDNCETGVACDLRKVASYLLLGVLFLIGAIVWMRLVHGTGLGPLGLHHPTRAAIWVGLGYGLGGRFLAMVTEAANYRIVEAVRGRAPETPEQIDLPGTPSVWFWIGLFVAVVIVAPLAEEVIFRGLTYVGIRARHGATTAIIVTSLFFAVTHIEPLLMPPLFVFAVVLGRLRESRDELMPCVVAHAAFNSIGFTALFIQHVT